jgi:hypothetical protein
MGIVGKAQLETADGLCLDLTQLFVDSADALRTANIVDFREYGTRLSDPVIRRIMDGNFGAKKEDDLLNVFVDGFMDGTPGSVKICMFVESSKLIREVELLNICWQPYIYGADKLATSMFIGNGMIPRIYDGPTGPDVNIADVTAMACAYIHACGEAHNIEFDPFCKTIGGRIHGAVVGPMGFQWIEGFKPTNVT